VYGSSTKRKVPRPLPPVDPPLDPVSQFREDFQELRSRVEPDKGLSKQANRIERFVNTMEELLNEIKAEQPNTVLNPPAEGFDNQQTSVKKAVGFQRGTAYVPEGCDQAVGTTVPVEVPGTCERAQGPTVSEHVFNPVPVDSGLNSSLAQFVDTMERLAVRSALPPLEVVKFNGDPCEYNKFVSRFNSMVHSQNLSACQKMARLMQFVDGRAKNAISGFDGVEGGLEKALTILKRRFGQPHMVTEACVQALVDGPNIASNDAEGLNNFADKTRTVLETLISLDAMGEMNMANLAKMARKLPVPLQYKWRDQAQKIRDFGGTPKLQDLVKFIERSADAANDPIFGKVGETKRDMPKSSSLVVPGPTKERRRNFSTQVHAAPAKKDPVVPAPARKRECYECKGNHLLRDCSDFKKGDYKHRSSIARLNGLCFNCLYKGHFLSECKTAPQCTECEGKHNTLLHREAEKPRPMNNNAIGTGSSVTGSKIALQTVPVRIIGPGGQSIKMFALLDSASEESFFDAKLARKLNIASDGQELLNVCTMTGESTVKVCKGVLQLKPASGDMPDGSAINVPVKVVDDFKIDASRPADISKWSHLKGITIPEIDEDQVSLLIGANVPTVQVHLETRIGGENEPYAVRTILGWSVFGPFDSGRQQQPKKKVKVNFLKRNEQEENIKILPAGHHVGVLIARDCHRRLGHTGREHVLAESRKHYWIVGGRRLAKQIVRGCNQPPCRYQNAHKMEQVMSSLPRSRLVPFEPAFSSTGIDLFGPLQVKWGRSTAKRWGCLFTCLRTRAVFIEPVQSLSTDDFILVLRQFISRRGPPDEIRSDNGSNFTCAEKELREAVERWNQEKITVALQQQGVKWIFQPPTAAHMSGVWERLIKSAKRHLRALSGDRLLTEYGLR
jgi:hypothetical protein